MSLIIAIKMYLQFIFEVINTSTVGSKLNDIHNPAKYIVAFLPHQSLHQWHLTAEIYSNQYHSHIRTSDKVTPNMEMET